MKEEYKFLKDGRAYYFSKEKDICGVKPYSIEPDTLSMQELINISDDLMEITKERKALGVAGIQVGVPYKIAVVRVSSFIDRDMFITVMNPVYYPMGSKTKNIEGCLTIPDQLFEVKRYKSVKSKFVTFNKDRSELVSVEMKFKGMDAFVYQHETDHCNGILCSQKGSFYRRYK